MKKLILVFVLFLLCGCGGGATQKTGGEYDEYIGRYEDKEAGVVCWAFKTGYAGGISCLPINQTKLHR